MNIPFLKIENFVVPQKEEQREVLKFVWLDVEGQRMLSTNGRMAARVTIGVTEDDVSGLIPIEAFELARKELKIISKILGKDTIPDPQLKVTAGEDAVVVHNLLTTTSHIVTRRKLVDGEKYPDVDAVIDAVAQKPATSLDAGYVADIVKSLDGAVVSIWAPAPDKAVVMAAQNGTGVIVLMPMKSEIDIAEVNKRGAKKLPG